MLIPQCQKQSQRIHKIKSTEMINVYTLSHRLENPSYILTKIWLKKK